MLCKPDTEKLTFREPTVHEANNDQLCVHVMNKATKVPFCPHRDFAQKAKSRGGTLVTSAYIKESTYS